MISGAKTKLSLLRNFREVVKNLKHRRPSAKLCPRCGSPKLRLSSRFDIWLFPEQYICVNCGYRGPVVMELVKEETKETNRGAANPTDASDSCNDS